MAKTLVFVPTYNEKENVQKLCQEILALKLELDILFIDDNSPDGTGALLDELARSEPRVKVQHRSGKLGIGSAHRTGIGWAYQHDYLTLITMDCDFTHPPARIPGLVGLAAGADIVVGSRFLQKNSLPGWNPLRKFLNSLGHFMTATLLRLPYDATGAFRLYHLDRISPAIFERVTSPGYSFFFESLYILHRNGYRIKEMPISLPARTYGHSKMRIIDAWRSFQLLLGIYYNSLFHSERYLIGKGNER
jgi:dolichol-phosphate mannosyltransferase